MDLDQLLEDVQVCLPDERDYAIAAGNTTWPEGWYAVSTGDELIVAYFMHAADAFAYRLALINARLNGKPIVTRYAKDQ